jgi:hypothetical protein
MPCSRRICERNPFRLICPVRRLKESEGIPYMKTVVSGLLTDAVSGIADTICGVSLTEFLHENRSRIKAGILRNLSL